MTNKNENSVKTSNEEINIDEDLILMIQCIDDVHRHLVLQYINEHLNHNPAYINSKIIMTDDKALLSANPGKTRSELKIPDCPCVLLYKNDALTQYEWDSLPRDFQIFFYNPM